MSKVEWQTDLESEPWIDISHEAIVAMDLYRTARSKTGSDSTTGREGGAPTHDDGAKNDEGTQAGEEELEEEQSFEINPVLSWETVQAVKYRLAIKRSMRDVAIILRAELAKIGPVKGMRVRAAGQRSR